MKNLRSAPILLLASLCLLASTTAHASDGLELEWLPHGRPFRLAPADPREIRMGIEFEGDSKMLATIGNYFSLLSLKPKDSDAWILHVGLEGAGYFGLRRADSRFPLETADGLIGFYTEGVTGPWQGQLRYTHISAHLADGSTATPIAYSREYAELRFGYVPSNDFQLYAGGTYLVNTVPVLPPWGLHWGGAFYFTWIKGGFTPFIAVDMKWKEESSYNPSFSGQIGMALNNPPQAYRSFRIFYEYYSGADFRGQFYDQYYSSNSIGIEMQI